MISTLVSALGLAAAGSYMLFYPVFLVVPILWAPLFCSLAFVPVMQSAAQSVTVCSAGECLTGTSNITRRM